MASGRSPTAKKVQELSRINRFLCLYNTARKTKWSVVAWPDEDNACMKGTAIERHDADCADTWGNHLAIELMEIPYKNPGQLPQNYWDEFFNKVSDIIKTNSIPGVGSVRLQNFKDTTEGKWSKEAARKYQIAMVKRITCIAQGMTVGDKAPISVPRCCEADLVKISLYPTSLVGWSHPRSTRPVSVCLDLQPDLAKLTTKSNQLLPAEKAGKRTLILLYCMHPFVDADTLRSCGCAKQSHVDECWILNPWAVNEPLIQQVW